MAANDPAEPRVSVVLPTFNEAESIGAVLSRLDATMRDAGLAWEAVVVDDDSPDDTATVARRVGRELAGQVHVVVRTEERGLGTAVVRGMREATGTYVCVMDADGQHPATAVADMVEAADGTGADVVIGSRHVPGGSTGSFAWHRRVVSSGAGFAAWLALPAVRRNHVRDPMSGLFLVRRSCVEAVKLRPRGYKVLLDVLVRARPTGRRLHVEEVPYMFGAREAGESKLDAGVAADFMVHLAGVAALDRHNRRVALVAVVVLALAAVVWAALGVL